VCREHEESRRRNSGKILFGSIGSEKDFGLESSLDRLLGCGVHNDLGTRQALPICRDGPVGIICFRKAAHQDCALLGWSLKHQRRTVMANLKRRVEELERQLGTERQAARQREAQSAQVQEALRDPYVWLRNSTKTYNEHWIEEKRPGPYEHFPDKPYFRPLFDLFIAEPIICIEKSRDLMVSWACVAYFLWEVMRTPMRGAAFQCQKEEKVKQLIKYAKTLYSQQPPWLKREFPLSKPLKDQSDLALEFAHGGLIKGLPGGADQVRSYHPWGYYNDETAFQPEAGECYDESLSAAQKIILNSSAGPGWYAGFKNDLELNIEDD